MFCTVSDMYSGESLRLNVAEEVAWVQLYTCLCYALAIKTITYHTPAASTLDLHKAWSTWHWLVRLTLHCQRHNAVHVSQLVTCQKLVSWPNHIFSPPSSLPSSLLPPLPLIQWHARQVGCTLWRMPTDDGGVWTGLLGHHDQVRWLVQAATCPRPCPLQLHCRGTEGRTEPWEWECVNHYLSVFVCVLVCISE